MIFNEIGQIAKQCWLEITKHYPSTNLDIFQIMPNHIHGIIEIESRAAVIRGDVIRDDVICDDVIRDAGIRDVGVQY
ncbi:TPA: hypothetical protein DCZ32_01630, partial [Candidatus Uhrbacteria bacterium]|nr:hypothetical protein [Candidatus Uhrbacteria bacterium]